MLAMTSATVVRGHEAALNQAAAAGESRSVGQPSLSYSQPRLRTAPLLPPAQCHMLEPYLDCILQLQSYLQDQ